MANIMKRNSSNMPAFGGLFDNLLPSSLGNFFNDDFGGLMTSNVPVNIRETDKTYELEVVAPGLKKDQFHVYVDDKLLTISFEHKEENKEEDKKAGYLRNEYRMQSFSRTFNLDETMNGDDVSARYSDGILHVTIPKKEGAQRISKSIQVK
jgi:HSP20 family protein